MSTKETKSAFKIFGEEFKRDQLPFHEIDMKISNGVHLTGSPLLILICSSLIASIGLNINSTPMVLGAKLISPIMIMLIGAGYGIATYKFALSRRAIKYFIIQFSIILITSTLYFLISPIKIPTTELISKTNVSIFDILVAFFGGIAAVIASTRFEKYNVLPGVALATSLVPPACTIGYGMANLNSKFIFGGLYVFGINIVFITFATFIFFKIIARDQIDEIEKKSAKHTQKFYIILTILFCIPVFISTSIYIKTEYANSIDNSNMYEYVKNEFNFEGSTVLESKIDTDNKTITVLMIGDMITKSDEKQLNDTLADYHLSNYNLNIVQGSDNVLIDFFHDKTQYLYQ